MASIFEEIAALDRPLVDVKLKIGNRVHDFQAQRPNALEADAIDAYYSDEYARLIVEKTEDKVDDTTGAVLECDLNQMRKIYHTRTREELTSQLLQTRQGDVERMTMEKLDFNPAEEVRILLDKSDEEREAHFVQRKHEMEEARKASVAEVRADYDSREFEELVELCSQINVNLKTIAEAQRAREAIYLFFVLKREGERVFPSADAIRQEMQTATIKSCVVQIEEAFKAQSAADLPFVSPGVSEPGGRPSSQSTSGAGTKTGGKRTKKTRGNSKRSSTHAAGRASKKA